MSWRAFMQVSESDFLFNAGHTQGGHLNRFEYLAGVHPYMCLLGCKSLKIQRFSSNCTSVVGFRIGYDILSKLSIRVQ
jgi:hypothetical protein